MSAAWTTVRAGAWFLSDCLFALCFALFSQADAILVLQSGCILESGTHAELLARKESVYFKLVRLQLEGMDIS